MSTYESEADIHHISWVTPDDFDPDKISLQASAASAGDTNERSKIMYEYKQGAPKKDLVITVPLVPEAFMICRGVKKDFFSRGDQRIETNRYGAHFVLNGDNNYHVALYDAFKKVQTKVEQLTSATVVFPTYDTGAYSILYTNLIHANDGRMYSSAYAEDEQLDILNVKQSVVRPALLLSTLKRSAKEVKIRVQVSQMFVYKEVMNFPLAHQE